jgi:mRNA interferase MazF
MPVNRGDVILAYVANVGSPGGKVRPALVVQSHHNNARLNETIIAAITSNVSRVQEPTQLPIDVASPDGAASGLLHDSSLRCERLHPIPQADVRRVIGTLSGALMLQVNDCLKAALGLS